MPAEGLGWEGMHCNLGPEGFQACGANVLCRAWTFSHTGGVPLKSCVKLCLFSLRADLQPPSIAAPKAQTPGPNVSEPLSPDIHCGPIVGTLA